MPRPLRDGSDRRSPRPGAGASASGFRVIVTNDGTGHALPSGTAAERRAWVHFVVADSAGTVLKESGMVGDDGSLFDRGAAEQRDKDLLVFGQTLLDADGKVVPFA